MNSHNKHTPKHATGCCSSRYPLLPCASHPVTQLSHTTVTCCSLPTCCSSLKGRKITSHDKQKQRHKIQPTSENDLASDGLGDEQASNSQHRDPACPQLCVGVKQSQRLLNALTPQVVAGGCGVQVLRSDKQQQEREKECYLALTSTDTNQRNGSCCTTTHSITPSCHSTNPTLTHVTNCHPP